MKLKFIARVFVIIFTWTNVVFAYKPQIADLELRIADLKTPDKMTGQLASLPLGLQIPSLSLPINKGFLSSQSKDLVSALKKSAIRNSQSAIVSPLPDALFSHVKLRDFHQTSSRETVLLLEDVHANLEAQEHISAALKAIGDVRGGTPVLVGLEGAEGAFLYDIYKELPDKQIATQVADSYLKSGSISGPAHAGFTAYPKQGSRNLQFWGVDDNKLYVENVLAYKGSSSLKPKVQTLLTSLNSNVEKQKSQVFHSALSEFDADVKSYRNGTLTLGAYLKKLSSFDVPASLNIETFLQAFEMESHLNFSVVEAERSQVLENLVEKMDSKELKSLVNLSLSYQAGSVSFAGYYEELKNLCKRHGVYLSHTPHFDDYIRYVLLTDGIKTDALFTEVNQLEKGVFQLLAQTREQKELIATSRQIYLTQQLLDFSLTTDQWREYRRLTAIINAQASNSNPSINHLQVSNSNRWVESLKLEHWLLNLSSFERFYEAAEARNEKMIENLLLKTRSENPQSAIRNPQLAVLVSGGFHTAGLTALLKKKNISYIVATPKVTKLEGGEATHYLSVFDREKSSLEKIFSGKKLFMVGTPEASAQNPAQVRRELPEMLLTNMVVDAADGALDPETTRVARRLGVRASLQSVRKTGAATLVTLKTKGTFLRAYVSKVGRNVSGPIRLFWKWIMSKTLGDTQVDIYGRRVVLSTAVSVGGGLLIHFIGEMMPSGVFRSTIEVTVGLAGIFGAIVGGEPPEDLVRSPEVILPISPDLLKKYEKEAADRFLRTVHNYYSEASFILRHDEGHQMTVKPRLTRESDTLKVAFIFGLKGDAIATAIFRPVDGFCSVIIEGKKGSRINGASQEEWMRLVAQHVFAVLVSLDLVRYSDDFRGKEYFMSVSNRASRRAEASSQVESKAQVPTPLSQIPVPPLRAPPKDPRAPGGGLHGLHLHPSWFVSGLGLFITYLAHEANHHGVWYTTGVGLIFSGVLYLLMDKNSVFTQSLKFAMSAPAGGPGSGGPSGEKSGGAPFRPGMPPGDSYTEFNERFSPENLEKRQEAMKSALALLSETAIEWHLATDEGIFVPADRPTSAPLNLLSGRDGAIGGAWAVGALNLAMEWRTYPNLRRAQPEVAMSKPPLVVLGNDAGNHSFTLKNNGIDALAAAGAEVLDLGAITPNTVEYFNWAVDYYRALFGQDRPVIGLYYTAGPDSARAAGIKLLYSLGDKVNFLTPEEIRNWWPASARDVIKSKKLTIYGPSLSPRAVDPFPIFNQWRGYLIGPGIFKGWGYLAHLLADFRNLGVPQALHPQRRTMPDSTVKPLAGLKIFIADTYYGTVIFFRRIGMGLKRSVAGFVTDLFDETGASRDPSTLQTSALSSQITFALERLLATGVNPIDVSLQYGVDGSLRSFSFNENGQLRLLSSQDQLLLIAPVLHDVFEWAFPLQNERERVIVVDEKYTLLAVRKELEAFGFKVIPSRPGIGRAQQTLQTYINLDPDNRIGVAMLGPNYLATALTNFLPDSTIVTSLILKRAAHFNGGLPALVNRTSNKVAQPLGHLPSPTQPSISAHASTPAQQVIDHLVKLDEDKEDPDPRSHLSLHYSVGIAALGYLVAYLALQAKSMGWYYGGIFLILSGAASLLIEMNPSLTQGLKWAMSSNPGNAGEGDAAPVAESQGELLTDSKQVTLDPGIPLEQLNRHFGEPHMSRRLLVMTHALAELKEEAMHQILPTADGIFLTNSLSVAQADSFAGRNGAISAAWIMGALKLVLRKRYESKDAAQPLVLVGHDADGLAFHLKNSGIDTLTEAGMEVRDLGAERPNSIEYFNWAMSYLQSIVGEGRPVIGFYYTTNPGSEASPGIKISYGLKNRIYPLTPVQYQRLLPRAVRMNVVKGEKLDVFLPNGKHGFVSFRWPRVHPHSIDLEHVYSRWQNMLTGEGVSDGPEDWRYLSVMARNLERLGLAQTIHPWMANSSRLKIVRNNDQHDERTSLESLSAEARFALLVPVLELVFRRAFAAEKKELVVVVDENCLLATKKLLEHLHFKVLPSKSGPANALETLREYISDEPDYRVAVAMVGPTFVATALTNFAEDQAAVESLILKRAAYAKGGIEGLIEFTSAATAILLNKDEPSKTAGSPLPQHEMRTFHLAAEGLGHTNVHGLPVQPPAGWRPPRLVLDFSIPLMILGAALTFAGAVGEGQIIVAGGALVHIGVRFPVVSWLTLKVGRVVTRFLNFVWNRLLYVSHHARVFLNGEVRLLKNDAIQTDRAWVVGLAKQSAPELSRPLAEIRNGSREQIVNARISLLDFNDDKNTPQRRYTIARLLGELRYAVAVVKGSLGSLIELFLKEGGVQVHTFHVNEPGTNLANTLGRLEDEIAALNTARDKAPLGFIVFVNNPNEELMDRVQAIVSQCNVQNIVYPLPDELKDKETGLFNYSDLLRYISLGEGRRFSVLDRLLNVPGKKKVFTATERHELYTADADILPFWKFILINIINNQISTMEPTDVMTSIWGAKQAHQST